MKKLSIVLALIMALSCFCFTAFAAEDESTTEKVVEEESSKTSTTQKPTTTKADPVKVTVTVVAKDSKGNNIEGMEKFIELELEGYKVGDTIKSETIIKTVKARVGYANIGEKKIDPEKFVVSPVVVLKDYNGEGGSEVESVTFGKGRSYDFYVYIIEIDPYENLAQVAATELAGNVDWKGIASANTALINQIINGAKAAADSLADADYPEIGEKKTEDAAKADGEVKGQKVVRTPDTGASAVAGVAVVVLALSATTAVVLRKKED